MAKGSAIPPRKGYASLQGRRHYTGWLTEAAIFPMSYVGGKKIHYMFALLFQRAAYFISDFGQGITAVVLSMMLRCLKISVFLAKVEKQMNLQDTLTSLPNRMRYANKQKPLTSISRYSCVTSPCFPDAYGDDRGKPAFGARPRMEVASTHARWAAFARA